MNTLFDIISVLDRKEMTRFKDFALSPYFNKHLEVQDILVYLNGIYPQFTEKNCSNEALWAAVFLEEKAALKKIPVLLTYVRRLLYQFLDVEAYGQSQTSDAVFLLTQLRRKKKVKEHLKHMDKERKSISNQQLRDSYFFYKQFLLDREADQMYTQQSVVAEKGALQQKANHLDAYYLSEKLKDACEMLVRGRMEKVEYSSVLLEAILEVIRKDSEQYFKIPPVYVYYHIYQMITGEETKYYEAAFDAVGKVAHYFPKEELQNIYNYLQNYCVYQINKGRREFLLASFELYQVQLEEGLLFVGDLLPEEHYKNMVTAGLRLQKLDWVYNFLEKYRTSLFAKVQENAYSYNLAEYYYATGEYKKAMRLLLQVNYTDPRYSMGSKALLLRTYYDLEEHEALMALCKSFAQLLRRDKSISEFRRKGYKNLFNFTKKLSQIRYQYPFTKKEKSAGALAGLKEQLKEATPVFNERWLESRLLAFDG
ncbi:MAG: hypothetical protein AB8F74_01035 [Saprospiraceae bacterium]